MLELDLSGLPAGLHLGTSSFSSKDWCGTFYPADLKPAGFLEHYARTFHTVEIDATWYAMPSRRTVEGWARKVSDDFIFSLKVPKEITHTRYLEGCEEEWMRFLRQLEPLGGKRGPLLFQFPYMAKGKDAEEYETGADFLRRLEAFAPQLPPDGQYAVEVRNAKWLHAPLLDLLRTHNITLVLSAYYTMPAPSKLFAQVDPVTGPFGYVRFLGNHRQMDALVKEAREKGKRDRDWGELIVDRARETSAWAEVGRQLLERQGHVYMYFNNHFAGFAPGSVELFAREWGRGT